MLDTLCRLAAEGMTMICVTQETRRAREVSDHGGVFHEGVMAGIAPPTALFAAPPCAGTRPSLAAAH